MIHKHNSLKAAESPGLMNKGGWAPEALGRSGLSQALVGGCEASWPAVNGDSHFNEAGGVRPGEHCRQVKESEF